MSARPDDPDAEGSSRETHASAVPPLLGHGGIGIGRPAGIDTALDRGSIVREISKLRPRLD